MRHRASVTEGGFSMQAKKEGHLCRLAGMLFFSVWDGGNITSPRSLLREQQRGVRRMIAISSPSPRRVVLFARVVVGHGIASGIFIPVASLFDLSPLAFAAAILNARKCRAARECSANNARDALGDRNALESRATQERTVFDRRQVLWERDARDAGAIRERKAVDFGHTLRERDALKTRAILERIRADIRHALRDRKIRQIRAAFERRVVDHPCALVNPAGANRVALCLYEHCVRILFISEIMGIIVFGI